MALLVDMAFFRARHVRPLTGPRWDFGKRALVEIDPQRFFLPPYMAHHGWTGLYVDVGRVEWREIEDLLVDAYKLAAMKTLARRI